MPNLVEYIIGPAARLGTAAQNECTLSDHVVAVSDAVEAPAGRAGMIH